MTVAVGNRPLGGLVRGLARIPPPPAFLVPLVIGVQAGGRVPLPLLPPALEGAGRGVGAALVALSVVLAVSCVLQFFARRTTIVPHRSASSLVTSGAYRFTRNPMYVSLTSLYVGVCALTNQLWPLVLLPLPLLLVALVHIPVEEDTLVGVFGDEYRRYAARVRRWV